MSLEIQCFSCQKKTNWDSIARRDECPYCNADVHVCLNCRFFDESFHHQCRESQAEYVKEKDRANFCEYFEGLPCEGSPKGPSCKDLLHKNSSSPSQSQSKADELLKAAQVLFKK